MWVVLRVGCSACVSCSCVRCKDVLVHSIRSRTVGLHVVCCSCGRPSCGLFFWCVVIRVVRVHVGVVAHVLVRFVRGHTVGLHVFVVHVVWCSCVRPSCALFFM